MLVNSNIIFSDAAKKGYAIGAYNINNLEWAKYILEACEDDKSPVFLAFTEGAIDYIGGYNVAYNIIKTLIDELSITVPVVLHLDHGRTFESCKKAIDAGFTSVMIDASHKSLEENIDLTCIVTEYAKKHNVSVEAELGNIGDEEEREQNFGKNCDIQECKEFVISTGIDSFAPAVGCKHGIYNEQPKLDFELLGAVCKETKIPLVLHGGSFLDDNKIRTAIFCGVCKININSEIQHAWASEVKNYINNNEDVIDPRKIISSGELAIKKVVHEKNKLFGSKNRANVSLF